MRAMIPHHSIAILTSEREDIAENGIASTQAEADARPVPDFQAES